MKKNGKVYENKGIDIVKTIGDGKEVRRAIWWCAEEQKAYIKWYGELEEVVKAHFYGYKTVNKLWV